MSDVLIELPRYQCHKQVWALKIKHVFKTERGCEMHFEEEHYAPIEMPAAWYEKHDPQPGGYFVWYEDGYKSYSPGDVFEAGYTRLAS